MMVISDDPWHSHLLPSVWQWSCHYLFLRLKICHFSDNFAQISLYKNINYSRSILANLNNTMQTEQNTSKKKNPHIKKETRLTRDYFLLRKDLLQRMFKILSFYSISWNCIQYIYISRGAAFLMR